MWALKRMAKSAAIRDCFGKLALRFGSVKALFKNPNQYRYYITLNIILNLEKCHITERKVTNVVQHRGFSLSSKYIWLSMLHILRHIKTNMTLNISLAMEEETKDNTCNEIKKREKPHQMPSWTSRPSSVYLTDTSALVCASPEIKILIQNINAGQGHWKLEYITTLYKTIHACEIVMALNRAVPSDSLVPEERLELLQYSSGWLKTDPGSYEETNDTLYHEFNP